MSADAEEGLIRGPAANTDAIFTTVKRVGVAWFAVNATEIVIDRPTRALQASGCALPQPLSQLPTNVCESPST